MMDAVQLGVQPQLSGMFCVMDPPGARPPSPPRPSAPLRVDGSAETDDPEDRGGVRAVARGRCEDGRIHFYGMRSSLAAFENQQERFQRCGDLALCVSNKGTGGLS